MNALTSSDVVCKPLPKQALALACPAFELLFGGSKGGGKSLYLVMSVLPILQLAQRKFEQTGRKQHKCRIMVFRKNLEDLKDFIAKSHEIYPVFDPAMGERGYHVNDKTWIFSSGATLAMRHLDSPTDHLGYNGNEFVALIFDEVQQISYEAYSFLVAQVRSSDPEYRKHLMVRASANPGGEDWLIKHFKIDECHMGGKIYSVPIDLPDGRRIETTRAFIRSWLRDNEHLDPDGSYEARLRATMNEDEIAMYLEGDFFRVAGSYFSKFLQPSLHFQRSKPLPSNYEWRYAIDWGSTAPACWLLGAKDPEGRLYVVDEVHLPGVTGRRFGELLSERFRRQSWSSEKRFKPDDIWGVIDKQAMDRYGSDASAADGIMEWGFRLFEAQKDRNSGCNAMKERLLMDRFGNPQVVIFEDRCPNLIRALSGIISQAPQKPDDYEDGSALSHACFIAGTMIRTPSGSVAIETLRPGDTVMTDIGPRRVDVAGMSSQSSDVLTVEFDDGTSLTGTADHPIYLADGSASRLDALRFSDSVSAWNGAKQSKLWSSTGSRIGVTRNQRTEAQDCISPQIPSQGLRDCIVRFGNIIAERSRAAITFIMSTAIQVTTGLRILPAFSGVIIFPVIGLKTHGHSERQLGLPLPVGMGVATASRFTANSGRRLGKLERGVRSVNATTVARDLSHISRVPDGAIRAASNNMRIALGNTPRSEFVSSVGRGSLPGDTQTPRLAIKRVLRVSPGGRAAVYNLTVADRHRYFANDTLVSNCDAFRFLCMEFPVHTQRHEDTKDRNLRQWEQYLDRARARQNGTNDLAMAGTGYE